MSYSRENAKTIARKQLPDFLLKAKKKGYVCPKCGNGTGDTGDGLVLDKKDGNHYKCFKCGIYADIFDLYGLYFGISDTAETFRQVYKYYGISVEKTANHYHSKQPSATTFSKQTGNSAVDYTDFFLQAIETNDFSYLQERGISENTQRKFSIGFVPAWVHPKAPRTPASPRCIIPTSRHSYLARDVRKSIPEQQQRYKKSKVGKIEIFNITEMNNANTVFITEGEIDAMSIYEASGGTATAIAIGSTAYHNIFMDKIKKIYNNQVFILMLDNDKADPKQQNQTAAGQKESQKLQNEFLGLNIPYLVADYKYKDPNEYLINDRDEMSNMIFLLQEKARHMQNVNKYNAAELLNYFRTIEKHSPILEIKTGFENLDRNLDGGLHEGLIVIGAISGLGKTTFALQLADQIASTDTDVIYFSLEMPAYELIAKSISRCTYQLTHDKKTTDSYFLPKETMQILNSRKYKNYSIEEKKIISDAIDNYEKSAEHLYIYEGRYQGERLTVQHIRNIVKKHIENKNKNPIIIVDYLQILAPADFYASEKQNIDISVYELKEIARYYSIPVIAISSFNRESYLEPISMTSFKESGAVEYSSDILFGLQYAGMDYQTGEKENDRKKRVRDLIKQAENKKNHKEQVEIELKCLKNRNGHIFTILYSATMAYNYMREMDEYKTITEELRKTNTNSIRQYRNEIPVR